MNICCISDTHNQHHKIQIPECDLLIHSGDFSYAGSVQEFAHFRQWWSGLTMPRILVPGNHDRQVWKHRGLLDELRSDNSWVLVDQTIEFGGHVIHGTPWIPWCGDWAWVFEDDEDNPFDPPDQTTILVSHGPSRGVMDLVKGAGCVGSMALDYWIKRLPNLKLHCFGHIHEGYGVEEVDRITRVNASQLDERYKLVNKPVMVTI